MSCNGACKGNVHINAASSPDSGDDVWASDDEGVSAYADRQRAQVNQGYLDGITNAQELGLQSGFDVGYPEGARLGIRVGRVLAMLHGTNLYEQACQELTIGKVLDRQYFNSLLDLEKDHKLVTHWEQCVSAAHADQGET